MEQLQTLKAIILLSDLRSQCRKSMKILQDLNEETETLNKESKTKQNEFYDIEKMYNEKIENLSKTMNEETLKHKIQEVDSSIGFSQNEIQKYKIKYAELQSMFENEMKCDDLSGIREYADEIMDETKDYERNLHTYNELKNEIANYEKLVENARKQLD
ncbi:hypothetical protein HHI36_013995 [Cryptolaemus montrouzieri]|uniref:Uncharacterized protein n=1 Tax=Cryptolaemus montrouzieri TaxID=559131 RepID=A0ABD2N1J9_9CUCU